ncbi:hypothetical protein CHAB381_0885 [Campylobacter hominis ATCC BAA-381]|uniref:Uncharacterized protein n=1 Tax=Campylobacter hominis (strain ATCC BAA-381 / DSM 21671 / CCUG 45161 / LMG 19568 / NCTC 13146 / CH001A) TaxID=360107 RepID=A7I1Q6_CAMHC|nr:hypothetical protein CHAB381_0885 [Campylobacter hominis ATCC BAA-381]
MWNLKKSNFLIYNISHFYTDPNYLKFYINIRAKIGSTV